VLGSASYFDGIELVDDTDEAKCNATLELMGRYCASDDEGSVWSDDCDDDEEDDCDDDFDDKDYERRARAAHAELVRAWVLNNETEEERRTREAKEEEEARDILDYRRTFICPRIVLL
jgi:hypothetical protein